MTTHHLKVEAPYFEPLRDGTKTFEVRPNDRHFEVGDTLCLEEMHASGEWKTGSRIWKRVTYVFTGDPRWPTALGGGYVVLGLAPYESSP